MDSQIVLAHQQKTKCQSCDARVRGASPDDTLKPLCKNDGRVVPDAHFVKPSILIALSGSLHTGQ